MECDRQTQTRGIFCADFFVALFVLVSATTSFAEAEKKAKAKAAQEQEERIARLDALWASLSPNDQEDIAKRARTHMPDFASKMLRKEEQEGRRSIGHEVLQSEIHKLLEAEYPAAAGA